MAKTKIKKVVKVNAKNLAASKTNGREKHGKTGMGKSEKHAKRQKAVGKSRKDIIDIPSAESDPEDVNMLNEEDNSFFQDHLQHAQFLASLSAKDIAKRRQLQVKQKRPKPPPSSSLSKQSDRNEGSSDAESDVSSLPSLTELGIDPDKYGSDDSFHSSAESDWDDDFDENGLQGDNDDLKMDLSEGSDSESEESLSFSESDVMPSATDEELEEQLATDKRKKKKKRKMDDASLEFEYEKSKSGVEPAKRLKQKLPLILPDGRKQHVLEEVEEADVVASEINEAEVTQTSQVLATIEQEESEESEESESEFSSAAVRALIKEDPGTLSVTEQQEQLAHAAQSILQDPEKHVERLKILRLISEKAKSLKVLQLALLSQLAVYKDIIPGYRIRILSDAEQNAKVSKDVRKMRRYEQTLLTNYQAYLASLDKYALPSKKKSDQIHPRIKSIATSCLCQLLQSVPHFNFLGNIIRAVVHLMARKQFTADVERCCNALKALFKEDESGEVGLEAVKEMSKMFKAKSYAVHKQVLSVLSYLRLREELDVRVGGANERKYDDNAKDKAEHSGKKRKGKDEPYLSKKQRKILKEQKIVAREMKESEAVFTKEQKQKMVTGLLYFLHITDVLE